MAESFDRSGASPASALEPTLGSALFDFEKSRAAERVSYKTSIKSIDAQLGDLFSGGKVIAIGQLGAEDDVEEQSLATSLIASHLLTNHTTTPSGTDGSLPAPAPSTYILAPPSTTVVSTLHSLLQHRIALTPNQRGHGTDTAEEASLSILNDVLLLPSLSLPGLASSLSDVSQRLYEQSQSKPKPVVLLIQGLSGMLTEMQRRSGATQTAALLANLMKSLRGLSRSYAWLMVLVEVGVEVGLSNGKGEGGAVGSGQGGDVESAFSSTKGEIMRVVPGGIVGRVLMDGIDVMVGVHDGYGRTREHDKQSAKGKEKTGGSGKVKTRIVEVWRDAVGHRSGEWCLWVQ